MATAEFICAHSIPFLVLGLISHASLIPTTLSVARPGPKPILPRLMAGDLKPDRHTGPLHRVAKAWPTTGWPSPHDGITTDKPFTNGALLTVATTQRICAQQTGPIADRSVSRCG